MKFVFALLLSVCLATTLLAEPTSEDNARLKKALQKFPDADANSDGVLTMSEAKAYRNKARGGTNTDRKRVPAKPQTVSAQTIVGSSVSLTVTSYEQYEAFPYTSVAVAITVVVPTWKLNGKVIGLPDPSV